MAETETQEIVVDFGKICRLCLTEEGVLISLFSIESLEDTNIKSIPDKILELMAIKVTKDDGFPSWICHNCLSQVDRCSEFFDMCRSSQSTLNESYFKALTDAGVSISALKSLYDEKTCDSLADDYDSLKYDKIEASESEEGFYADVAIKEENGSDTEELKNEDANDSDSENRNYICRDCVKCYANLDEFLVHRISVHHDDLVTETGVIDDKITGLWSCDACNLNFYNRNAITTHLRLKHQICDDYENLNVGKLIYCKYCGSSFTRKQILRHLQVVHKLAKNIEFSQTETDSLDCKICFRPFTRQSALRNHIEKFHSDSLEAVAEAENCDIVLKCGECDSLFSEDVSLLQHYSERHSNYPIETDTLKILISKSLICHCGVINSNSIDSFVHDLFCHREEEEEEDERRAIECLACYEVFEHLYDLKRHVISFHWFIASSYDNECAFCSQQFPSNELLRVHLYGEHGITLHDHRSDDLADENFQKTEDENGNEDKIELDIEEANEDPKEIPQKTSPDEKLTCVSCGQTYDSREELENHVGECSTSYWCELCGKVYKSRMHLKRHIIEYHNTMSPVKCPLCPKVFPRKLNLHNHYKRRHLKQTKKYVCSYCGVSLKGKVALRSHEDRLHRNIRNYKCTECPEAFTTRSILRKHAQRHLADRPMLQCQYCERKFSTISGIERHVKTHGGVKDFLCDVPMCGKSFYTKSELKRHTKFHTRDFKHICPICSHKFMTPGELKKHSTKHTGERPFKCHLCPCAYSRRDDKVKHLKRVHNLKVKRIYGKPLRKYSDEKDENVDTIVVDEEPAVEDAAPSEVFADLSIIE